MSFLGRLNTRININGKTQTPAERVQATIRASKIVAKQQFTPFSGESRHKNLKMLASSTT